LASLMEDLINVLNQEEEQYQGLIELGKKKREVVIRADIKTLDEITATEQEAASNLQNLAKKRTRVLNPGEVTITKMISYLEEQPVEQKQLMEVKERLLQTGKEMAAINEQNEILLNQALEMVEFDLTLLKSMRQAPETANYNKNACNTGDLLGSSGFDAKQ
jgi:uncharacterized protein YyaL (SSP411 family)